jgi:NAD-dependent SIR2 family protein deacetylase
LVEAIRLRQAVLFAGAGISFPSLGIAGSGIMEAIGAKIAQDYPGYDPRERTFEDVCDEFVAINDRTALVNQIAAQIPQNATPTPAHILAVQLFRFIVTTNWDLLFEQAYRQVGQGYQVLSAESDAPNFSYDQHNLLKIHGSVDRPQTIVATTDDYEAYAETHKILLDRLADLLYTNTIVFVGYGLRDEHVRHLISTVRRERGAWARKAYAVGFFDPVRSVLLKSRDIVVIESTADEVLTEIQARL